jgi:hypothetical protein
LSGVFLGAFVLLLSVFLAVAGLIMTHRVVSLDLRQSHTTAIGIIYGALHVTFGVIIGFSAYLVLNKYTAAENIAAGEAGAAVEIHRLAEQFPEHKRDQIRELASSYVQVVVDEEWPLMRDGQVSPRAEALAYELGRTIDNFEPNTESEKEVYAQGLDRFTDLHKDRQVRLLNVRQGLRTILWAVLVMLATITILFSYFLGMENRRIHMLAVAALAAGIAFIISTIVGLDDPFGGDLRVGPDAFESALNTMIEENREQKP